MILNLNIIQRFLKLFHHLELSQLVVFQDILPIDCFFDNIIIIDSIRKKI